MTSDPNFALTFASDRVLVASPATSPRAAAITRCTMTDKATNKPVTSSGSYLTVYRKQADGSWKAVEDFITPGPAPGGSQVA